MEAKREDRIRLSNYILGRSLGQGSFGVVKLGEHLQTNQLVAVKILNRRNMQRQNVTMKVSREVKILQKFNHPHIIRLFDVIETPTDIFLVLEYGSNGELFDYIVAKRSLPEDEARKYFQQLISGVAYCHANDITHRDLKPENILLTADFDIKVADFGLSNVIQDGQFLRTSCGSPNYAAPEVISGRVYHGPEVDLWSCGVILYALLTGSLPFDEENLVGLFKRIKSGYYNMPPLLNNSAKELIAKLLIVEPLKRGTIDFVTRSPWFRKNLPKYLDCSPNQQSVDSEVDYDLVKQVQYRLKNNLFVQKCGTKGTLHAIKSSKANEIKILYDMLLFAKHKNLREKSVSANYKRSLSEDSFLDSIKDAETFPSSSEKVQMSMNATTPRSISNHDSSLTNSPFARACAQTSAQSTELFGQRHRMPPSDPHRRRWYLGIQSKKEPELVMREVFRVLKMLNAEWDTIPKAPYCIICRWKLKASESGRYPYIYMKLQLLRVQNSICLLDFQRVGNSCSPTKFNDLTAKIINSLKPPSARKK